MMLLFRHLSPVFLLSLLVTTAEAVSDPTSTAIRLRDLAKPRWVGTAANTSYLYNDQNYTKIAKTQFSILTTENEMKWEMIEPGPNVFNFTPADTIVKFADSIGAKMRGHTLMWGNQLAPWVNTSLSATQLDRALKNHIDKVLGHFKGKIYAWDVINEMISDTPGEIYKQNIWTQKFGEEAMAKALVYARKADPKAKLYINDYRIEGINAKSDALYEVAKGYKRDGIPLDAIGFQAHFYLGQVPTTFRENLKRFIDLDLDVAITELDINMRGPGNETSLAQQAADYHEVVSVCMEFERCVSVTVWGISDDYSWIRTGNPLPWDRVKAPKPAFYAMADAFQRK